MLNSVNIDHYCILLISLASGSQYGMMKSSNIIILLVLLMYLTLANSCDTNTSRHNVTDIHIIGFFPCTDPNDTRGIPVDNCDGIERIPIMKLALEEINERCDLLLGYRLVVDYANSAVS